MKGRNNILWIVATQWRAQACGYAGDPNARTPCLGRLAAESVNFTQAVTPHPFGPFARAALLTGVPSPENGVRDYFDPLPEDTRTIAHQMAEAGYATAFFGKWHLAKRDPSAPLVGDAHAKMKVPPAARGGFEFWEGFEGGFLLNDPWLHGTRLPEPTRFEGYQADVLCSRAAEWIRSARPSPYFCVVSLESPHPPYDAPAAGIKPADPRAVILAANVPRGGDVEEKARRELAGYYAHIEATDRAIGRLIDETSADTLVVFTSVHGDMHGAHGLFRKGWPHEESVRVPLLVRVPGTGSGTRRAMGEPSSLRYAAPRGRWAMGSDNSSVSLLDLHEWTLAWANDNPSPIAHRPSPYISISMPSVVHLPHQCDRVWHGLRTRTRKLALNTDGTPWLFFDLENDPLEMENLAGDPDRGREIADLKTAMGVPPMTGENMG